MRLKIRTQRKWQNLNICLSVRISKRKLQNKRDEDNIPNNKELPQNFRQNESDKF